MAKVALLIGVSEYGQGLTNLPGTQADLSAMEQVLKDPKIGAFDKVEKLP
ncbi:MAG: caspase family protein, partial [Cyanobacteria bacterium P01_H01_bin.119]